MNDLKCGDGDGPNLCRVKKVDVSNSTFIENLFRSGLTLVSSNDIITNKIDKKKFKNFVKNHTKFVLVRFLYWSDVCTGPIFVLVRCLYQSDVCKSDVCTVRAL